MNTSANGPNKSSTTQLNKHKMYVIHFLLIVHSLKKIIQQIIIEIKIVWKSFAKT